MALDFPNIPPPTEGQLYVGANGVTYVFSGGKWVGQGASGSNVTTTTDSLFNANFVVDLDTTGNLNIPADGDIVRSGLSLFDTVEALQANSTGEDVAAANVQIGLLWANAAVQATSINTINANVAAANLSVAALSANIGNLVNNAPAALDTLFEIANSLGNSASLSTTLMTAISGVRANVNAANTEIASTNANLAAFSAYANLTFTGGGGGGSTYSNANVAAYLVDNPQSGTYSNANVVAYLDSFYTYANATYSTVANAAAAHSEIDGLRANITAANSVIASNYNTFLSNAAAAHSEINALRANITAANSVMISNAGVQASDINALRANITAANTLISSLQTQTYSNANVTAYLAGDVTVGNLTTSGFLTTDLQIEDNYIQLRSGAANDDINIAPSGTTGAAYLQLPNDTTAAQFDTRLHNDVGNVEIGANTHSWTFGNNGDLTLPTGGAINYANGVSILDGIGGTYSNTNVAAYLVDNPQSGTYSNVNVAAYINNGISVALGPINFTASPPAFSTPGIQWPNGFQSSRYGNTEVASYLTENNYVTAANLSGYATTAALQTLDANTGAYQTWANIEIGTKAPAASPTFTGNVAAQGNVTVNNNMTVLGNLSVQGTTTTVNATTLTLTDKFITVANGSTNNNEANGAGLYVPGSAANILYTSIDDAWTLNKTISGTGNIKAAGWFLGTTFAYANGVNILSDLYSNAATQATAIATLIANAAAQATSINTLDANVGAFQIFANANAVTQATSISSINANIGAFQTFANANAAAQAASINTLTTNAATQQTSINTINANLGAYQAYANATFSVSSYGNANVAAYLPVHSGNLQAAFITTLGTYGNITGANVISANTFVFGANGVNILSAVTVATANLVNGSNVVALLSNGNLLLPNNMNFMSSPAVSTTGIVFGDGKFQRTAYTGPDSVLVNGGYNAALDPAGNLTVPGSILPNTDNVFDLGSPAMRFRHLYVGPGTVYVGNAAIKTTVTGNLILPGVTRAVASSAFVEQVETTGDQSYSFATNPVIIDNAQFEQLSGGQVPAFTPATYLSSGIDADGYVRNITVDTAGSGYAGGVADLAEQNMWATEAADPVNNFNISDWIQIPFRAETRAGESEYEFGTGGGDRLTNNGYEMVLNSDGDLTVPGAISIDGGDGSIAPDGDDLVISWDNEELILKSVSGDVQVEADNEFTIKVQYDGNDYTGKWTFSNNNELVNIGADTGIVSEGGELRLQGGRDTLSSANVKIVSVNNGVAIHNWIFDTTGNIEFPDGTKQNTAYTGGGGGGGDTGNITFNDNEIGSSGDFVNIVGDEYAQLQSNGNYVWVDNSGAHIEISNDGGVFDFERVGGVTRLKLPVGGDIVDSNGASVLGGLTDRLVNGEYEVVLGADGKLTAPDDIVVGENGRFVKDCNNTTGTTSMRWINVPTNNNSIELIRVYSGSGNGERAQIKLNWLDEDRSGLTIRSFDRTDSESIVRHDWQFQGNGGLQFPDDTVQTTAYRNIVQDNLMLDGGAAATIYEVTVDYAEGGFSSTRYGVNTPSFNGGSAELDEAIYYTLDGGGA